MRGTCTFLHLESEICSLVAPPPPPTPRRKLPQAVPKPASAPRPTPSPIMVEAAVVERKLKATSKAYTPPPPPTPTAAPPAPTAPTTAEPPDELKCPVSCQLMSDPVTLCDGTSYERAAIERWLEQNDTSPMTGDVLPMKVLIPALQLRSLCSTWRAAHPEYDGDVHDVRAVRGSTVVLGSAFPTL